MTLDLEVISMADERERHTFTQAQIIPGKASANPGQNLPEPNADETTGEGQGTTAPAQGFPEDPPSAPSQAPESEKKQKQLKTAAELAEMIELDLASHPDCPKAGFRVTVYGWPRWRAMLTIEPAAGGVRNPQDWRELTQELAERLRKRYDVAWED
jgi:hypothetical protein